MRYIEKVGNFEELKNFIYTQHEKLKKEKIMTRVQSILNSIIKKADSKENGGNGNGKIDTRKEVSLFNQEVENRLYQYDATINSERSESFDRERKAKMQGRRVGGAIGGIGTPAILALTTGLVSAGPAGWAVLGLGAVAGLAVGSLVGGEIGKNNADVDRYQYIANEKFAFKVAVERYKSEHQLDTLN